MYVNCSVHSLAWACICFARTFLAKYLSQSRGRGGGGVLLLKLMYSFLVLTSAAVSTAEAFQSQWHWLDTFVTTRVKHFL